MQAAMLRIVDSGMGVIYKATAVNGYATEQGIPSRRAKGGQRALEMAGGDEQVHGFSRDGGQKSLRVGCRTAAGCAPSFVCH